jgi:hypothetical protein
MTYNDKANKASQKYQAAHWTRVPLSVPNSEYHAFRAVCDSHNEKVNTVLRRLMAEYVAKLQDGTTSDK